MFPQNITPLNLAIVDEHRRRAEPGRLRGLLPLQVFLQGRSVNVPIFDNKQTSWFYLRQFATSNRILGLKCTILHLKIFGKTLRHKVFIGFPILAQIRDVHGNEIPGGSRNPGESRGHETKIKCLVMEMGISSFDGNW